jgi:phosphate transport system substrate-binding protein
MARLTWVFLAAWLSIGTSFAETVSIVGTGDGLETMQRLASAYTKQNPATQLLIPPSIGSGGGISAVGGDQEILGRIARPLSDKEKELGITYRPLMQIPIAFIVHASAGVRALTAQHLRDLYSGKITSWKEIGGADLRVRLVRREDSDSSLVILRRTMPGWSDLVLSSRSRLAATTQEALSVVLDNPGAIGFLPNSELVGKSITPVTIDGAAPMDESYPSAVTVAIIFKPARLTPAANEVLRFLASESAAAIIRQSGAKVPNHAF